MAARRYRWDEWFSLGSSFRLVKGQHFNCTFTAMTQQIRNEASKRGYRVSISELDDSLIIHTRKSSRHAEANPTPKHASRSRKQRAPTSDGPKDASLRRD